jgi:hypothetical protein
MRPDAPSSTAVVMQRGLAAALLDPAVEPPSSTVARHGKSVNGRFNVYRNNVVVSLIEALAAIYPAVQRLTGHDFFRAMARMHIRETPPASPLLFEYGRDFPSFIDRYPYAQEVPWLGDVARIERAWLDACHAADAPPLAPDALAHVSQADLSELRFAAHPAARVVRSRYSAGSIFTVNRAADPVIQMDASAAEDVLITRPGMEVELRYLPVGGAAFLQRLLAGASLGIAASEALEAHPSFDLAANLSGLIQAGAVTDIRLRNQ